MTAAVDENIATRQKIKARCSKCNQPLHSRARRGWFVKTFLYWLPIRKYRCYKCNREQYVIVRK